MVTTKPTTVASRLLKLRCRSRQTTMPNPTKVVPKLLSVGLNLSLPEQMKSIARTKGFLFGIILISITSSVSASACGQCDQKLIYGTNSRNWDISDRFKICHRCLWRYYENAFYCLNESGSDIIPRCRTYREDGPHKVFRALTFGKGWFCPACYRSLNKQFNSHDENHKYGAWSHQEVEDHIRLHKSSLMQEKKNAFISYLKIPEYGCCARRAGTGSRCGKPPGENKYTCEECFTRLRRPQMVHPPKLKNSKVDDQPPTDDVIKVRKEANVCLGCCKWLDWHAVAPLCTRCVHDKRFKRGT